MPSTTIDLVVRGGTILGTHNDWLADLYAEGNTSIQRASHVEPVTEDGQIKWVADMSPMNGPKLGPYLLRCAALFAEELWLRTNIIK